MVFNQEQVGFATKATLAAFDSQTNSQGIANILNKILKEDTLAKLENGKKKLEDFDIPGADMDLFIQKFNALKDDEAVFQIHSLFTEKVLAFEKGQNGVLVNGKTIGPLDSDETFGSDDFSLLTRFSMSQFGEKLVNSIHSFFKTKDNPINLSDLAMKLGSLLVSRPESKTRSEIQYYGDSHSKIEIAPMNPGRPSFDLVAIIDPLSQGAQKISATLNTLSKVLNAKIRIFFNCVDKHSEMPQKSYFRLALDPELTFTASGALSSGPGVKFQNLPETPVLTMHYHIPDNWLIEPVKSVYDLDNIKLANVDGSIGKIWMIIFL